MKTVTLTLVSVNPIAKLGKDEHPDSLEFVFSASHEGCALDVVVVGRKDRMEYVEMNAASTIRHLISPSLEGDERVNIDFKRSVEGSQ
jgi:hypothetical protein